MKKIGLIFTILILLGMLSVGVVSLVDTDPTVSVVENRTLATLPEFSAQALFDGTYLPAMEAYYADTFPMRERLMEMNKKLNGFYYYSGKGENNVLILPSSNGAEQGGVSLDDYEKAIGEQPEQPSVPVSEIPETPDEPPTEQPPEPIEEQPEQQPEEQPPEEKPDVTEQVDADAPHDSGWTVNDDAEYKDCGSIIIIGDQAMEVPTQVPSAMADYAATLNAFSEKLPEVQVYSLITPNAAEFYSPREFHIGAHGQKDMIESTYSQMSDAVKTVDIYSKLAERTDQYIYFRTDHHWTARGAYFAYIAFCEEKGLEPVSLEDFETGRYDEFVGSLYTFTSQYPQSEALWSNPDYVEYFLPIVETHAKYYSTSALADGIPISVVSTNISDSSRQNKYLCFICGDTPICVIETGVEDGPTCVVLKESYGNAFVPFLTSHYSKIIVIDPREFNHGGKPTLDLVSFAQEQGVDDLLVINYPFMINNAYYIGYLRSLIGE